MSNWAISNVEVRISGQTYVLSCQTMDALYHVWLDRNTYHQLDTTLYKNPRVGPREPGYFKTRSLDATNATNAPLVQLMLNIANRDKLFSKAELALAVEADAEDQARRARIRLRAVKAMGVEFAYALEETQKLLLQMGWAVSQREDLRNRYAANKALIESVEDSF